MKKIILVLFLLTIAITGYAEIRVEGYRVYYGEKNTDHIDVCEELRWNGKEFVSYYIDKSDIQKITYYGFGKYYEIIKKNSVWRLYYLGDIKNMILVLIEPSLNTDYETIIYEKE